MRSVQKMGATAAITTASSIPTTEPSVVEKTATGETSADQVFSIPPITSGFQKVKDFANAPFDPGGDNFVTTPAGTTGNSNSTKIDDDDNAVCVFNVRKHLCIRIIACVHGYAKKKNSDSPQRLKRQQKNSSNNNNNNEENNAADETSYNIWVYDVSRGLEWNTISPKTLSEFVSLRSRLSALRPSISQISFPKTDLLSNLSEALSGGRNAAEGRRSLLEKFLRKLAGLPFTSNLHPNR